METGRSFSPPAGAPALTRAEQAIVDAFTQLYYRHWRHDRLGGSGSVSIGWLGHLAQKCPTDLWTCQEIIVETRPDVIIETGSCLGGSGLFMATICDLLGQGRVVSIDITGREDFPRHPRLEFRTGSSTDPALVAAVKATIPAGARVMVVLDSDHRAEHVEAELAAWAPLVSPGFYLIVEDTAIGGNPILPEAGPGPMAALDRFLAAGAPFAVDRSRERFLLTLTPRGYLRRLAAAA